MLAAFINAVLVTNAGSIIPASSIETHLHFFASKPIPYSQFNCFLIISLEFNPAFSAICLPMIFKYGSEKGRVMYIAVVVVFCVAFVNFGGYDFSEVSQLSGAFAVFAENPIYMVVLAVIAAVLFLGSMKLSEQFYMKREL